MGLWSPTISWLPGLRAEEAAHVCSSWVDKLYNVCVLRVSSAPGTESPLVRDIMVSRFLPSSATFPLSSTGCQHCAVLQPCPAASSAPQTLPWGKWRFYLVKLLCNRAAITALLLLLGPWSQQNQLTGHLLKFVGPYCLLLLLKESSNLHVCPKQHLIVPLLEGLSHASCSKVTS